MMIKSKFLAGLAVLVGTAMGAGYLGIPFVLSKSGFLLGLICLFLVAGFMLVTKLYLGEVSLRTNGNHQLTGYARKYLGRSGEILMFFAMIFGIYSALVAYMLAEGKSLSFMFFANQSYSFIFSILFWLVMAGLTFIGLSALKKYEKTSMVLVFATLILIFIVLIKSVRIENLAYNVPSNFFLPFGVILFSFLAFSAVPEVRRLIRGQEKLLKKIIFFGILIPLIVYAIFSFVLLGNFGKNINEIATLNLGRFFSILGILTMFTAYFTSALAIRDMFRFDLKISRFFSWILASLIPLILFLVMSFFRISSFIQILSISGVVSGGLTGVLILIMNYFAKQKGTRKPEYSVPINWWIIIIMSLIFVLVVLGEFLTR